MRHPLFQIPPQKALKSAAVLALPASLAAMITPLLGLVDLAVLSRYGTEADVAGVALAGAVFSILYWTLGFLRMSVAGLTAQADGRGDEAGTRAHLVQGILFGALIGVILMTFRTQIASLSIWAMGSSTAASPAALNAMQTYIEIRLLAAPFVITFFSGIGYLTGQGRTGALMVVVLTMTILNGALDYYFVAHQGMGTTGIATGTAMAEAAGALLLSTAIAIILHQRGGIFSNWQRHKLTQGLSKVIALNGDIFLRTLCLSLVFAYFTRTGGGFGDLTVAANQILMHLTLTAGLLLDGPAIAAETLVGKALGQKKQRRAAFAQAISATSTLAFSAAIVLALVLLVFGPQILAMISPEDGKNPALFAEAKHYLIWAALSPLIMVLPFQLDGIYIGATRGAALRNSMIGAGALFVLGVIVFPPMIGNHGLWLAFGLFMGGRAALLLMAWGGFAAMLEESPNA